MPIELEAFDAVEVFQIAEQIERNGKQFYEKAAEFFANDSVSKIFRNLASWEGRHEELFADMRRQFDVPESHRGSDDLLPEARLMAGLAVFGITADPKDSFSGNESRLEVLREALQYEHDAIIFYGGLRSFVADDKSIGCILTIIAEEVRHVCIITEAIAEDRQ